MSFNIEDIDLDQPIETSAGRAAKQVDVTERLLAKLTSGFPVDQELIEQAKELGVDVDAVVAKVKELYEEEEDE